MRVLKPLAMLAGLGVTACHSPSTGTVTTAQDCSLVYDVPPGCDSPGGDPSVILTTVSVTPTVLHPGDQLTASASASFGDCEAPAMITIAYANAEYWGGPPTFSVSLTAVAGQTVVLFDAECDPAVAPLRADTIQVLP